MSNRIALVDDDQNILTSIAMALEAEGFQVSTYKDGEAALRGLDQRPVDLAVLDIKMPRMDGMELLQRIRRDSALPLIFMTSKDDEIDEVLVFAWAPTTTSKAILTTLVDRTHPRLAATPGHGRRRWRPGRRTC